MAYAIDFRPVVRMAMAAKGWFVIVKDGGKEVRVGPYATPADAVQTHGAEVLKSYFGDAA